MSDQTTDGRLDHMNQEIGKALANAKLFGVGAICIKDDGTVSSLPPTGMSVDEMENYLGVKLDPLADIENDE